MPDGPMPDADLARFAPPPGDAHKRQRKMLTPVFSESNLRDLTPIFYEVAHRVRPSTPPKRAASLTRPRFAARGGHFRGSAVWRDEGRGHARLDGTRCARDHRPGGTGALLRPAHLPHGVRHVHQGGENIPVRPLPDHNHLVVAYRGHLPRSPLSFTPLMVAMRQASPILTKLGPAWFRRWLVDMLPLAQVQQLKDVVDVLHDTSVRIIAEKRALLEGGKFSAGKDIISILRKSCSRLARARCGLTTFRTRARMCGPGAGEQ